MPRTRNPSYRGRALIRLGIAFLAIVALAASALVLSTGGLAAFGARPDPVRLAALARKSRYEDGKFVNLEPPSPPRGIERPSLLELFFGGQRRRPPGPLRLYEGRATLDAPQSSGVRVTWLGHSTLLIEADGARVLTDPIWSERASPSSLVGPRRFHPPPVPLTALPKLDAVVISHDHYDHLDMATVEALAATGVRFFVPLGVAAHLKAWGVPEDQLVELDWWGEARVTPAVSVVATPSRHYSGRSLGARNTTLWASWVIRGAQHRVYFSGDSGPTPQLEEIGRRHGPFDVVMLEVGAFHPSWGDIHLGPEKALEAHRMLGGGPLLPIHWSTFNLAPHPWDEPLERLTQLARERGVTVLTPQLGAPLVIGDDTRFGPWWREVADSGEHP
jgi:L-ascorbate metabolism protein UlaG (beta-lactamase superfamily)